MTADDKCCLMLNDVWKYTAKFDAVNEMLPSCSIYEDNKKISWDQEYRHIC